MRLAGNIFVLAAAVSCRAQTASFVAEFNGKPIGVATVSLTAERNLTVSEKSTFNISLGGRKIEIKSVDIVGLDGRPIHLEVEQSTDGRAVIDVSVSFLHGVAHFTDKLLKKQFEFRAPASPSYVDPGATWFVSTRPHKGAKVTASVFAPDARAWETATRTYTSDVPVLVGGRTVVGHLIESSGSGVTSAKVVDDHGLPLRFAVAQLTFTRK